ncbi:MAG: hypothetical protein ACI3XS_05805 [Eubacteriales bacterium]
MKKKLVQKNKLKRNREGKARQSRFHKRNNRAFLFIHIFSFLILCASIILHIVLLQKDNAEIYEKIFTQKFVDAICIITQTIPTISLCMISIIIIPLSIQKETSFGISSSEFEKIRTDLHYSMRTMIIISFCLIALDVACILLNLFFESLAISAIILLFSILEIIQELPLIQKNKTALFGIITDRLIKDATTDNLQSSKIAKSAVIYALLIDKDYTFKSVYDILSKEDKNHDKEWLLYLLQLQSDSVFNNSISNEEILVESLSERYLENIESCFCQDINVEGVLGSDVNGYKYHFTRILFELSRKSQDCKRLVLKKVEGWIERFTYTDDTHLCFSTLLTFISLSLANGDFSPAKILKVANSRNYFSFPKDGEMSLMFGMISFQLYYLANCAKTSSTSFADSIKRFVNESYIENMEQVLSWKELFERFSSECKVSYDLYKRAYIENNYNWESHVVSPFGYFEVLTLQNIQKWSVFLYFCNENIVTLDFSSIIGNIEEQNERVLWAEIIDSFFNSDNVFMVPTWLQEMIDFYQVDCCILQTVNSYEEGVKKLLEYRNNLHKIIICDNNAIYKNFDANQFLTLFKEKFMDILNNQFGYDDSLKCDGSFKITDMLIRKMPDISQVSKSMSANYFNSICHEIRNNLSPLITSMNVNDFIKQYSKEILDSKSISCSDSTEYVLKYHRSRNVGWDTLSGKVKQIYKSAILYGRTLLLDEDFHFNIEIEKAGVAELSDNQIKMLSEKYKLPDGKYRFENATLSYEEIKQILSDRYAYFYVIYRTTTNVIEDKHVFELIE